MTSPTVPPSAAAVSTAGAVERTFRAEHGRCVATVARVLGDLGVAEDAVAEAYVVALRTWPERGTPDNPGAWITTTARNRGLDRLRRESRRPDKEVAAARQTLHEDVPATDPLHPIPDDELRLLFTCCHPALAAESQVVLTLRLACGLRTAQIARLLLRPEPTVAQRLSRAKRRVRTAGIPFRVPAPEELPARVPTVLACIELIYGEGYAATQGDVLIRAELCREGVRLARSLAGSLPDPEVLGLEALLRLLDARRAARTTPAGDLVLLEDQDRSRWDRREIDRAVEVLERALAAGRPGPYQLRAAIAAEHAVARDAASTDWRTVARLYGSLARHEPTPVVELNRAVAIAFAEGPAAGLAHLAVVEGDERLARSHLLPATRADLLRRLGRWDEAREAYREAIELAPNAPERRYLAGRAAALDARAAD